MLLHQGVALVLLISQNAVDGGLAPFRLASGRGYASGIQMAAKCPPGFSLQKQPKDEPYNRGFFLICNRRPVLALFIAREIAGLSVSKLLPLVFRSRFHSCGFPPEQTRTGL